MFLACHYRVESRESGKKDIYQLTTQVQQLSIQHTSSVDARVKRHVLLGLSVFLLFLSILSTMVPPASGTIFPEKHGSYHALVDSGFSTAITLSDNQYNYAAAWDTASMSVRVGLIPRSRITSFSSPTFNMTKEIKGNNFSANYPYLDSPSILLWDNGTVCLVMRTDPDDLGSKRRMLFFTSSGDNGSTWTTPYELTGINETTVRNNYLFQLNGTHIIALWEETFNGATPNGPFSIVYRISSDFGVTWDPKVNIFVNSTNQLSAIKARNGEIILSMSIDTQEYRPGKNISASNIYLEHYFPITANLTAINDTEPQLLSSHEGTSPFFMNTFDNGDLIFTWGTHLILFYRTLGKFSGLYELFESETLFPSFMGIYMAGGNTALAVFTLGNKCYVKYLDNFVEVSDPGLPPEAILAIVVVIILGIQIGLYTLNKMRKRKNAPGKSAGTSGAKPAPDEKGPGTKPSSDGKEPAEKAPGEKEPGTKPSSDGKEPAEKAPGEKSSTEKAQNSKPSKELKPEAEKDIANLSNKGDRKEPVDKKGNDVSQISNGSSTTEPAPEKKK